MSEFDQENHETEDFEERKKGWYDDAFAWRYERNFNGLLTAEEQQEATDMWHRFCRTARPLTIEIYEGLKDLKEAGEAVMSVVSRIVVTCTTPSGSWAVRLKVFVRGIRTSFSL